jgi:ribosomal protein S27AE
MKDFEIRGKPISYWKQNAEEDYVKVPLSVLKYITILEEAVKLELNHEHCNCGQNALKYTTHIEIPTCGRCGNKITNPN